MVVLGKVRTRIEQSTDSWVAVVVGQQYNKKGSRRWGPSINEEGGVLDGKRKSFGLCCC